MGRPGWRRGTTCLCCTRSLILTQAHAWPSLSWWPSSIESHQALLRCSLKSSHNFYHILLVNTGHTASPDSPGGEIDLISWWETLQRVVAVSAVYQSPPGLPQGCLENLSRKKRGQGKKLLINRPLLLLRAWQLSLLSSFWIPHGDERPQTLTIITKTTWFSVNVYILFQSKQYSHLFLFPLHLYANCMTVFVELCTLPAQEISVGFTFIVFLN